MPNFWQVAPLGWREQAKLEQQRRKKPSFFAPPVDTDYGAMVGGDVTAQAPPPPRSRPPTPWLGRAIPAVARKVGPVLGKLREEYLPSRPGTPEFSQEVGALPLRLLQEAGEPFAQAGQTGFAQAFNLIKTGRPQAVPPGGLGFEQQQEELAERTGPIGYAAGTAAFDPLVGPFLPGQVVAGARLAAKGAKAVGKAAGPYAKAVGSEWVTATGGGVPQRVTAGKRAPKGAKPPAAPAAPAEAAKGAASTAAKIKSLEEELLRINRAKTREINAAWSRMEKADAANPMAFKENGERYQRETAILESEYAPKIRPIVEQLRAIEQPGAVPLAPKPPAAPAAAKEPLLPTKAKEWADAWLKREEELGGDIGEYGWHRALTESAHDARLWAAQEVPYLKNLSTDMRSFNKWLAERALAKGKPVPAEVLADYPELAAKAAPAAAAEAAKPAGQRFTVFRDDRGLWSVRDNQVGVTSGSYSSEGAAQRFIQRTGEAEIVNAKLVARQQQLEEGTKAAKAAAKERAKAAPPAATIPGPTGAATKAAAPVSPQATIPKGPFGPQGPFPEPSPIKPGQQAVRPGGPGGRPPVTAPPAQAGGVPPRQPPVTGPPLAPPPAQPPSQASPERLLHIPSNDEILTQRLPADRFTAVAGALNKPVLRNIVGAINPSAVIKTVPEKAKFIQRVILSEFENRKPAFLSQLAVKPKPFKAVDGIVQGVTAKQPGLSLHEADIVERPHLYNLTPEQEAYFDTAQRLSDQLTLAAIENNVPMNALKVEVGETIYHRMVVNVRGVTKAGAGGARASTGAKQGIQKARYYATAEEGSKAGVVYADTLAALEEKYNMVSKLIADRRLADMVNPLGRTPKAPEVVRRTSATAIISYRHARQAERVIEGAFHGERQLTQTVNRVAQVDATLGRKFKEAMAIKAPEAREKALAPLVIEAKNLSIGKKFIADKARGEVKRALDIMRQPRIEPPEGRIISPFAANRIFPKDIADQMNKLESERVGGVLKAMSAAAAVPRFMGTTFDAGIMTLQLQTSISHPKIWGEAVAKMFGIMFRPKLAVGYYSKAENMELYRKLAESGKMLEMSGTEFTEAARRGGFMSKIPIIKQASRPFVRAFDFPGNFVRTEMAKLDIEAAEKAGRVGEMVDAINHITGRMGEIGMGPTQKALESSLLFFSPHYTRSIFATLIDISKGRLAGRTALTRLVKTAAIGATVISVVRQANGQNIRDGLVPDSFEFGSVRIGNVNFGIGGGFRAAIYAAGMIEKAIQDGDAAKVPELVARYLRGRSSPFTSMVVDNLEGETYIGEPLETWAQRGVWAASQLLPFQWRDYLYSDSPGVLSQPVQAFGARVSPLNTTQRRNDLARAMAAAGTIALPEGKAAETVTYTDLQPRDQAKVRNSTEGMAISAKQKMSGQERTIRARKELDYQQQAQRDTYLQQGYRIDGLGEQVPYSVKDWRKDYDRAQVEIATRGEFKQALLGQFKGKTKTEEQKALEGYYAISDEFTEPASGITDVGRLAEALNNYVNGLSPDLAYYVQENTHPNRTPQIEEYLKAKRVLAAYWDAKRKGMGTRMNNGKTLQEYYDDMLLLQNIAREKQGTEEGRKAAIQASGMAASEEWRARAGDVDDAAFIFRLQHPDVDALLVQWGYASKPARQQEKAKKFMVGAR